MGNNTAAAKRDSLKRGKSSKTELKPRALNHNLNLGLIEFQLNFLPIFDLASDNFIGQIVQDNLLDQTSYRPCSEVRIKTLLNQLFLDLRFYFNPHLLFLQLLLHLIQLKLNDLRDISPLKRIENQNFVKPV